MISMLKHNSTCQQSFRDMSCICYRGTWLQQPVSNLIWLQLGCHLKALLCARSKVWFRLCHPLSEGLPHLSALQQRT